MKVATLIVAFAVVSAALETAAFRAFGLTTVTSNGTLDAIAALETFRLSIAFTIVLAVAIATMCVVTLSAGGSGKQLGAAIVAGTILVVLGFCAAALSPVLFFVPLVVFLALFLYTPAAILIGADGPVAGLLESCRVAAADVRSTLAVVGLIVAVSLAGAWLGGLMGRWSEFAGWWLAGLAQQGIVAYAALSVARTYASSRPELGL